MSGMWTGGCPCGSGQEYGSDGKCGACRGTFPITSTYYVYTHDWASVTISRAANGYVATYRGQTYVFPGLDVALAWIKERL